MPLEEPQKLEVQVKKIHRKEAGLPTTPPKEPLYSKKQNAEVATLLKLEDLRGTDLFTIVHDITQKATQMMDG